MAEGQDGGFLREVQDLADKFKEDDEQYISPYAQLEKAAVLQEARYVAKGNRRWNCIYCQQTQGPKAILASSDVTVNTNIEKGSGKTIHPLARIE